MPDNPQSKAINWALERASRACQISPDLITDRPRRGLRRIVLAAARGARITACLLRALGLSAGSIGWALGLSAPAVNTAVRRARASPRDAAVVQRIIKSDEFRELRAVIREAKRDWPIVERVARIEERMLRLESMVRSVTSPDFRRLDALILAGWGGVPQDKIPLEVLVRALLGLNVPPPRPGPATRAETDKCGELATAASPAPEC